MGDVNKNIENLKDALKKNDRSKFESCVQKLETPENGYAFTNIRKYTDDDFFGEYFEKFDDVKRNTIQLGSNKNGSNYIDAYIFSYMYSGFVVIDFIDWRKNNEIAKAYNEFKRRIEDGLDFLWNNADSNRRHEMLKLYYDRFVQSIIRNSEMSVDLKINLLSYVYALMNYYKDDRCLEKKKIDEVFLMPVYGEYKNDDRFKDILEHVDDETDDYWISYVNELKNYKKSVSANPEPMTEPTSGKEDRRKDTSDGVLGKLLPTLFSRNLVLVLAALVIALLTICSALWFSRKPSDNSDHNAGDVTAETEQGSTESSDVSHEEKPGAQRDDRIESSSAIETESSVDSSGGNDATQSQSESGNEDASPQDDQDTTPRYLIISAEDENGSRNLRATPSAEEDYNILVEIPGKTEVKILNDLDEDWLYIEYTPTAEENGKKYEYGYKGYVKRQDGDEVSEK